MAWPTATQSPIHCIGFPRKHLPIVQKAIDDKKITWGRLSMFCGLTQAEFTWNGCKWQLKEHYEVVTSIALLKGTPRFA